MRIKVINGPNLDLLGTREPEVYGSTTLADLEDQIAAFATTLGVGVEFFQSNEEGDLIAAIHGAARGYDGIVINPGALTHTSRALGTRSLQSGLQLWRSTSRTSETRAMARRLAGLGSLCPNHLWARARWLPGRHPSPGESRRRSCEDPSLWAAHRPGGRPEGAAG